MDNTTIINDVNGSNGDNPTSQGLQTKLEFKIIVLGAIIALEQLNTSFRKEADLTLVAHTQGMVQNRKQHREPVIRALLALPGETLVEASAFLVAGFVYQHKTPNRKQQL